MYYVSDNISLYFLQKCCETMPSCPLSSPSSTHERPNSDATLWPADSFPATEPLLALPELGESAGVAAALRANHSEVSLGL